MNLKDFDIEFYNDWSDMSPSLITIELLSFHVARDWVNKKVTDIWITVLGFGLWLKRKGD